MQSRRSRHAWLFLLPSLLGVMVFVGVPFLDVIRRSFCTPVTMEFTGFSNYQEVWNNRAFRLAASNTLRFMGFGIPLLMLASFLVGLLVEKGDTPQGLFKTTIVLPIAIPVASIVILWKIIFCGQGLWNQFLSAWTGTIWDQDIIVGSGAFYVLSTTFLWKHTGYDMLLWLAGLASIPDSLYEAAKVDGAGPVQRVLHITLPGLKDTCLLVLILSAVNSFRIYRESYLIAGAYPDESIYMMQNLFNNWFLNLDVQKMSTAAVLMTLTFLLPVLVFIIIKKIRRNRHET